MNFMQVPLELILKSALETVDIPVFTLFHLFSPYLKYMKIHEKTHLLQLPAFGGFE